MKTISIIASALLVTTTFTACSMSQEKVKSSTISSYLDSKKDVNSSVSKKADQNVTESKTIKNYLVDKKKNDEMILENTKSQELQFFNIRTGDNAKTLFERMSLLDGRTYVVTREDDFSATFNANGIKTFKDLIDYMAANDYTVVEKSATESRFVKIDVKKSQNATEKRLSEVQVSLSGMPNVSEAIQSIAHAAKVKVEYLDKSAGDISALNSHISFQGDGLEAIHQLTAKAGLGAEIKNDKIALSYFETETMNVDIFTRDRNMLSILSNVPSQSAGVSTGSTTGTTVSTGTTSTGSTGSTGQDLSVAYSTQLFNELRISIDSSLSKYGTYSFLPTTGQVVVRDKAENVKTVQKLVSNFNSKFKDTITGRITFYKVSMDKSDKRGLDIKALIGTHYGFSSTNMIASALPAVGGATSGFGISATAGSNTGLLQFLKQLGATEVVNSIDFEAQSNSIKTVKVANNYGYISSANSNVTSGGTGSTTAGGITPSSVPDGTYASIIAKSLGNDTVAFDIYATANSLTKFNTVSAFGTQVQTPDTAEQSIDGYHQVHAGIPYVLLSYKFNQTTHDSQGLPFGWEWLQKIGMNADSNKDVFIIVALEAAVK